MMIMTFTIMCTSDKESLKVWRRSRPRVQQLVHPGVLERRAVEETSGRGGAKVKTSVNGGRESIIENHWQSFKIRIGSGIIILHLC